MAEETGISWCDSTFNPWLGCTKVGPGCDHCYAEALMDKRWKRVRWGSGQPRLRTNEITWKTPLFWERQHKASMLAHGRRRLVFTASLADIFDNEVPEAWRADYWALVRKCPNLDFLIVTKRIGNAARMLPPDWSDGYPNVVLLATVVNQDEADRDVPKLLATPARARGLSMEPLLGAVDLTRWLTRCDHGSQPGPGGVGGVMCAECGGAGHGCTRLHWIIVGGESGPDARPMHPDWAYGLRNQCEAAGVSLHFKQWGEWASPGMRAFGAVAGEVRHIRSNGAFWNPPPDDENADVVTMKKVGKAAAGRELGGRTHDGLPELRRG